MTINMNDSHAISIAQIRKFLQASQIINLEISKVKYKIISENQIIITFKTNNNSKGTVRYGVDTNLKQKEKGSKNKKSMLSISKI